jgi:short chain dehydrogenase
MKAALPHLQASGGTIINVSSVLGKRAVPLQAAYCATKHGIVAFSEALRLELQAQGSPVQVVTVLPSGINTPLFENARSKIGVIPKPLSRVYEPSVVAEAIVAAAGHPVRQIYAGFAGRMLDVMQRLSPSLTDWYLRGPANVIASQHTDVAADDRDNLFSPTTGKDSAIGRFGQHSKSTSVYTRMFGMRPVAGRVAAVAGLAATALLIRRVGRRW